MSINIHPCTNNPTKAWIHLKKTQNQTILNNESPTGVIPKDKIRIVCMSDSHSSHNDCRNIPDGDIFIHAGDFTFLGLKDEVIEFSQFLKLLPHKHKLVIAGNHELSFDSRLRSQGEIPTLGWSRNEMRKAIMTDNVRQYLIDCNYLEDSGVELYGLKFYGTPWQPEHHGWAFNLTRGKACLDKWNLIPDDCDVLITHTPPVGYGDRCDAVIHAGCVELLSTVQNRVKPKYHVFGHIHEAYGISSDGVTTFINASMCDINYWPVNPPIVFDIALPDGVTKEM